MKGDEDPPMVTRESINPQSYSFWNKNGFVTQVEFSNKLASVYDAYQKLLGPDAKVYIILFVQNHTLPVITYKIAF